ncbi:MAG TPA: hypothetical protein PKL84_11550 [Candidatus Hydrogenedentes bacterium]|nr:hypothetical protein [Candidatus Hydrogenedentota bacterium]
MVSRHNTHRCIGVFLSSLLVLVTDAFADEPPVDIGRRLELFVDTYLIDGMQGAAELRLHHPVRREVAIVHDAPWEGNGGGYHTVFQDDEVYRMYYHAWQTPLSGGQTHPLYIAYAESPDGIHWVKPNLGLVEFNGTRANNIVLAEINGGECHDFAPFKDTNPGVAPGEEYKAIGLGRNPHGLYAFKSSDAIHWTLCNGSAPVMTGHPFDTQNITFWDPTIGKYRAYIRDFENGCRGIMTATSDDYLHWSEREWLEFPDAPTEQLYTNQVKPYYRAAHILIGFPSRYVDRGWTPATRALPSLDLREERARTSERYGTAVTDALFMTSRDGRTFHRWDEAFIRPGLRTRHNWAYGDNYIAWHVVETASADDDSPRELSLYATESYFTGDSSRLRRYTMRIDGFASVFAPLGGGEMTTKPLIFSGDRLTLNFSTSAGGGIRVEIQDAAGNPVPGYALDACDEIFGDALECAVQWRGNADIAPLAGQPVRLRFALKDADVFALRFAGSITSEK